MELLDKVTDKLLEQAMDEEIGSEEQRAAFDEAMKAVDRKIELQKVKNAKRDRIWQAAIGIGGTILVPVAVALFKHWSKNDFLIKVGQIEQFETYTTIPGRSIKDFFRHD